MRAFEHEMFKEKCLTQLLLASKLGTPWRAALIRLQIRLCVGEFESTFPQGKVLAENIPQLEKGKLHCSFPKTKLNYTVGWLAASMILTNFSGTRDAPPIRPPSMSG